MTRLTSSQCAVPISIPTYSSESRFGLQCPVVALIARTDRATIVCRRPWRLGTARSDSRGVWWFRSFSRVRRPDLRVARNNQERILAV